VDALPLGPSGKVLKRVLLAKWIEEHEGEQRTQPQEAQAATSA
jgi:hypothetical protein